MKLGKERLVVYLLCPLLLGALLVIATLGGYLISREAGTMCLIVTVIYYALALFFYFYHRTGILRDYSDFAMDYNKAQRTVIEEMKTPYAVLNSEGTVIFSNAEFREISRKSHRGYSIRELLPGVKAFSIPKQTGEERNYRAVIGDKHFRVYMKTLSDASIGEDLKKQKVTDSKGRRPDYPVAVFLYDETEIRMLKQENYENRQICGLLYIDNYDEVLETVDEVKRSLLTALVDQKINKYMTGINALIKKIEKDKYFFVFQNKYLSELTDRKFSILEEVRSVNLGTAESVITVSIGLGVNAPSYAVSYEYARAAIDLALGRGGDQAVIKDGDNITYYGGKSESVEKSTRVKARVKAHALRELMEAKDVIYIMGHANSDVDAFGACIGVYRIAKHLGKKAHVVVNEVGSSVRPMITQFFNSTDYEEDMFISNLKALELAQPEDLLVIVDVNRPSITECPELVDHIHDIIVLDHHRLTTDSIDNAQLSYVEPYASSACELVAEILQYIGDGLKIRPLEAEAMYAGIMIDTNNFLTKTGVRTFEAAAFLRRNGADITKIRKAFRMDMNEYLEKAKAIAGTEIYLDSFALAICEAENVESPTVLGAQVANDLMEINGIRASFVFTPYKDKIYVSARSVDEVNVQVVMEKLGGGGHMTVAGTQFTDIDAEEAVRRVKAVLYSMQRGGEL
ncbi:MAG: DHH family phosphoesterase [Lachnospiraceae bacterium]|nr:DHH family phosphoesterase [Lachnospiraceae bacterium]MBR5667889.1 DHH family phosphoesterase [Lachnospiraceae bacterium]